jgi:hypothetical protein
VGGQSGCQPCDTELWYSLCLTLSVEEEVNDEFHVHTARPDF